MQRDVIRLPWNEPIRIHLDKGPEGTQKPSKFGGVDYLYTVNRSAGLLYLPPQGRDALFDCGAQAGDEVAIRKYRRGNVEMFDAEVIPQNGHPGNPPRRDEYTGNPAQNGNRNHPPDNPPNGYPSRLLPSADAYQQNGRRSMPLASTDSYDRRAAAMPIPSGHRETPRPIPDLASVRRIDAEVRRDQEQARQGEPARDSRSSYESQSFVDSQPMSPTAKHMALCLCEAVDALAASAEYARRKGMGLTFLGADVRSAADCMFIQDNQNNKFRGAA